jgi:TIR domain
MSKIVVSYRRVDSQAIAGRMTDRLIAQFGEPSVFMDVDNIPFGTDFRHHIQSVLAQAQVLIAVVGPEWLGVSADGNSRIQEEEDPVRVEIETAMRLEIKIIPVLVNGASMPNAAALPESLKRFAFLNAAPLDSGRDFRPHMDRLAKSIEDLLARQSGAAAAKEPAASGPKRATSLLLIAGALVAMLLVGGVIAWQISTPPGGGPTATATTAANSDDGQWASVRTSNDIPALRHFIDDHPGSKHRADAEALLLGLLSRVSASASSDESGWTQAKTADTYDAYQAYLKAYPQGAHLAEATQAAAEVRPIANALKEEPGIGRLMPGHTAIVDDHDPMCKRGEVKVVTGGDITKVPIVYRTKKCVPRDELP